MMIPTDRLEVLAERARISAIDMIAWGSGHQLAQQAESRFLDLLHHVLGIRRFAMSQEKTPVEIMEILLQVHETDLENYRTQFFQMKNSIMGAQFNGQDGPM